MSIIVDRFNKIKSNIHNSINIIAVSKTFDLAHISPLIEYGHKNFGENKVQEAEVKWKKAKELNPDIQLHMIGKLQSNKAKKAVQLFDYIHSLDSQKLADTLSKQEDQLNKKLKYFIQVNVGMESQKSGIPKNEIDEFFTFCTKEKKLNIIGLMAIPPNDGNQEKHYEYLNESNSSLGLKDLSIGMSDDYLLAVKHKATFIRIGSSIFGERT